MTSEPLRGTVLPVEITVHHAQLVVDHHRGQQTAIASFQELPNRGFSAFTLSKNYVVTLEDGTSYILRVSPPTLRNAETYTPNSLIEESILLETIKKQTNVPTPEMHALDLTSSLIPYPYLLVASPPGVPLSEVRKHGKLTPQQSLLLDLRLGSYLKELHEQVQNDWFGLPSQEEDELYSWQEAFTWQLEALLSEAQALGVELPYEDVRRYLSRAIGFFLFDDCEVPSLISLTADESSIFVNYDLASPPETDDIEITSFATPSHALWGDPLLETLFMDPSSALIEGYGGPLVVFARQRTKRLWYTLFIALMVVVQTRRHPEVWPEKDWGAKIEWARETLNKCISELKDAACY